MNQSKIKWEISPFSAKILRNQGSGDHHEITYKQKVFFNPILNVQGKIRFHQDDPDVVMLHNIINNVS